MTLDLAGESCRPRSRNLVANGLDAGVAWVRRLYADPAGRLVAASSTGRFYVGGLAALLRVRDQGLCRTPYCDAPIRHLDHVTPVAQHGITAVEDGQGLCEACNLAKSSGALHQAVVRGADRHTVVTTTPTGDRHVSTAPALPRPADRRRQAPGPAVSGGARRRPSRVRRRREVRHRESPVDRALAALLETLSASAVGVGVGGGEG